MPMRLLGLSIEAGVDDLRQLDRLDHRRALQVRALIAEELDDAVRIWKYGHPSRRKTDLVRRDD